MPRWMPALGVIALLAAAAWLLTRTGAAPPPASGPWVSFLTPGNDKCVWRRLDIAPRTETTLADFEIGCEELLLHWSPDRTRVLIQDVRFGRDVRFWLSNRSGDLVVIPDPPFRFRGITWRDRDLFAVTVDDPIPFETTRFFGLMVESRAIEGPEPPQMAREWRLVGGEWVEVAVAELSHSKRESWLEARAPRRKWSQPHLERGQVLSPGEQTRVVTATGPAAWMALATSAGTVFIEQNGVHGLLAFDHGARVTPANGLAQVPAISTIIESTADHVLITGAASRDWPRLYEFRTGALVWSSDDAVETSLHAE